MAQGLQNQPGPRSGLPSTAVVESSAVSLIAPLWTVQDVARYLQVPVQTLYTWRTQGSGPRARRVGKYLRYKPEDVLVWLDERDSGAA